MADIAALTRLIEPAVKAEGLALVRVMMIGGAGDPALQVMAERPDTRQLGLDDCARLSRRLSDILDDADPIEHSYRLEVSSPGIDRPLTRLKDYEDWQGHEAKITLHEKWGGRRQFTGTLAGIEDQNVRILCRDAGCVSLPFTLVKSAKLLLTEELIKATAPLSSQGADKIDIERSR